MGIEIERKFLIDTSKLPQLKQGLPVKQSYIQAAGHTVVRARLSGDKAWLAVKGGNTNLSRLEFEYEIPVEDAAEMINQLCSGPAIEKTRYLLQHGKHTWEIDIFEGENMGLTIAEVELASEDEQVEIPDWVTTEVTGEPRYYNSNLLHAPYNSWPDNQRDK